RAVDPGQPLFAPATMDEIVGGAVAQRRFTTMVLVAFAATALGLAAIGIYGVVAFATSLRAHEIAIRMSLGARDRDLVGLMLRPALPPVAAGVVLGLAGALAAARGLSSLLFHVRPMDPAIFAGVAGLLVAVAALACWLPARRAARVDPMSALRAS